MPLESIPTDVSPPFDEASVPETIVLTADRARLRLAWPGGVSADVDAPKLRTACRCAWCTRARIDGTFVDAADDVAIERVAPIGDYAVNIVFTDGHARGIFPWTFLRKIALGDDIRDTRTARGVGPRLQGASA